MRFIKTYVHYAILGALLFSSVTPLAQAVPEPSKKYNVKWVFNQLDAGYNRFKLQGRLRIANGLKRFAVPSEQENEAVRKWVEGDTLSLQDKKIWQAFRNRALMHPGAIIAIVSTILVILAVAGGAVYARRSRNKKKLKAEQQEKERLEQEQLEKEQLEKERLEQERLEKERLAGEQKKKRLEKNRLKRERKNLLKIVSFGEQKAKKAYEVALYLESENYKVMAKDILNFYFNLDKKENELFMSYLSQSAKNRVNKLRMSYEFLKKHKENFNRAEELLKKDKSSSLHDDDWVIVPDKPLEHWQKLKEELEKYQSNIERNYSKGDLTSFNKESFKELYESIKEEGIATKEKRKMAEELKPFLTEGLKQGSLALLINKVYKEGSSRSYEEIEEWVESALAKVKDFNIAPKEVYKFIGGNQTLSILQLKNLIKSKVDRLKLQYSKESLEWLGRQLEYLFKNEAQKALYDAYLGGPSAVEKLPTNAKVEEIRQTQAGDLIEVMTALLELQQALK